MEVNTKDWVSANRLTINQQVQTTHIWKHLQAFFVICTFFIFKKWDSNITKDFGILSDWGVLQIQFLLLYSQQVFGCDSKVVKSSSEDQLVYLWVFCVGQVESEPSCCSTLLFMVNSALKKTLCLKIKVQFSLPSNLKPVSGGFKVNFVEHKIFNCVFPPEIDFLRKKSLFPCD